MVQVTYQDIKTLLLHSLVHFGFADLVPSVTPAAKVMYDQGRFHGSKKQYELTFSSSYPSHDKLKLEVVGTVHKLLARVNPGGEPAEYTRYVHLTQHRALHGEITVAVELYYFRVSAEDDDFDALD